MDKLSIHLVNLSDELNFTFTKNTTLDPDCNQSAHFCQWILYRTFFINRVRIWDLLLLIPNVIFFIFLLFRLKLAKNRLKANNLPIFFTFYVLVCINVVTSITRCIFSMLLNASTSIGGSLNIIFWILVRFFFLSIEIFVLVFGFAFGHLESKASIKRVLVVTFLSSFAYSFFQGTLEIIEPDENFHVKETNFQLFGHGGAFFQIFTCTIFALIYFIILTLPYIPCDKKITIPTKRSFYVYIFLLFILNWLQALGSGLYYYHYIEGLCLINITTYIYFTLFTPLVYLACLAKFFSTNKSLMFSYKLQNDSLGDNLSIHSIDYSSHSHQLFFTSLKPENYVKMFQPKVVNSNSTETYINELNPSYLQWPSFFSNSIQNQNLK